MKSAYFFRLTQPRLFLLATLLLLITFGTSSCSSKAVGTITPKGGMELEMEISMAGPFAAYLKDLQETLGGQPSEGLFDKKEIENVLAKEPDIELKKLTTTPVSTTLFLNINSLTKLGNHPRLKGLITFKSSGGTDTCSFMAGPRLMTALLGYVRPGDAEALEYILPGEQVETTAQYEEQLIWALEEYGTAKELKAMFSGAKIRVELTVPRPLKAVKGAAKTGPQQVLYEANVLQVMTLKTDTLIEFSY